MDHRHRQHLVQVGQVEEVLFLVDDHPLLDPDRPPIVAGVDDEPVVRRPDRAPFYLALEHLLPVDMPLEPLVLIIQHRLGRAHISFQHAASDPRGRVIAEDLELGSGSASTGTPIAVR